MQSAIFPRQNFRNSLEEIKQTCKTRVSKANSRRAEKKVKEGTRRWSAKCCAREGWTWGGGYTAGA